MIDEHGKRKAKPQPPAIPPHISEDFTPAQKKAFATAKQSAPKRAAKKSGARKAAKKAPATKGAAKKAARTKKVTAPRPADTEPASE